MTFVYVVLGVLVALAIFAVLPDDVIVTVGTTAIAVGGLALIGAVLFVAYLVIGTNGLLAIGGLFAVVLIGAYAMADHALYGSKGRGDKPSGDDKDYWWP